MMRADRDSTRRPRLSTKSRDRGHTAKNHDARVCREMAQEVTTPTLKEALKQDKAQFDDCTPCRIVGKKFSDPAQLKYTFEACS